MTSKLNQRKRNVLRNFLITARSRYGSSTIRRWMKRDDNQTQSQSWDNQSSTIEYSCLCKQCFQLSSSWFLHEIKFKQRMQKKNTHKHRSIELMERGGGRTISGLRGGGQWGPTDFFSEHRTQHPSSSWGWKTWRASAGKDVQTKWKLERKTGVKCSRNHSRARRDWRFLFSINCLTLSTSTRASFEFCSSEARAAASTTELHWLILVLIKEVPAYNLAISCTSAADYYSE